MSKRKHTGKAPVTSPVSEAITAGDTVADIARKLAAENGIDADDDTPEGVKLLVSGKLYGELKTTIGEFFAAGVLDESDAARVLMVLAASIRVELDGKTGNPALDEILADIGQQAGMAPCPEQTLQ